MFRSGNEWQLMPSLTDVFQVNTNGANGSILSICFSIAHRICLCKEMPIEHIRLDWHTVVFCWLPSRLEEFDVFIDIRLNKRLSKQSRRW